MLYFLLPREHSSHVTVGGKFGLWHLTLGFVLPHPGPYFNVLPFSWEVPQPATPLHKLFSLLGLSFLATPHPHPSQTLLYFMMLSSLKSTPDL